MLRNRPELIPCGDMARRAICQKQSATFCVHMFNPPRCNVAHPCLSYHPSLPPAADQYPRPRTLNTSQSERRNSLRSDTWRSDSVVSTASSYSQSAAGVGTERSASGETCSGIPRGVFPSVVMWITRGVYFARIVPKTQQQQAKDI